MSYNDVSSLQSNDTLDSDGLVSYVASGIISISVTIDGKKLSVPTQYKQPLIEVCLRYYLNIVISQSIIATKES